MPKFDDIGSDNMDNRREWLARDSIRTQPFKPHRVARVPTRISFTRQLNGKIELNISYIPHKLLLEYQSLDEWLGHYQTYDAPLEHLAMQLVDDINNEIVPYWISVELDDGTGYRILAEDCQPNWRGKTIIMPEASQRSFNRLMRGF
ncbi:MAG: hypothetical protein K0U45_07455 [Alphaproteobacteria bacterium]|nr:hypothetical protein [Alphaproteobacteria bacterium]